MSDQERDAIAAMGRDLSPAVLGAVQDLYRTQQTRWADEQPPVLADAAYGDDPRQRLDLYAPAAEQANNRPILLWVHGGGFLRGDKGGPGQPFNAHAGRWAARNGMIGAVMNYRLAPDHTWPAGAEDVGAAVAWLRANAACHGGDPHRIVLVGTSAGATHVAAHLGLRADAPGVIGAVLLSALYGITPLSDRDMLYYGSAALYPQRRPLAGAVATDVPLLVVNAGYDPLRFAEEGAGFLQARRERAHATTQSVVVPGHNHFSVAYHLGAGDDVTLARAMLDFIDTCATAHVAEHAAEAR